MKKYMIFSLLVLTAFTCAYPRIIISFPDMVKPTWLRVNAGYIYISDQHSIFVYDLNSSKMIKRLCNKGEGPNEFKSEPKIDFSNDKLILNDPFKIIFYSKDFKYIDEIKLNTFADRLEALENNFILKTSQVIDNKQFLVFSLYNTKLEKIKDLVRVPDNSKSYNFLIFPYPVCRTWKDRVFIAQPHKGFYIDVFDNYGKKLYQIEKTVKKIKFEEKHRRLHMENIRVVIGRNLFEKYKNRGAFNKPMTEFLPDINNFWVKEDNIYVKTYDITDTTEKFIIMDIKGTLLKTIFLPKTYREIIAFDKNVFYYLEDNEDVNGWVLHAVEIWGAGGPGRDLRAGDGE